MTPRRALGTDPFEAVLPAQPTAKAPARPAPTPRAKSAPVPVDDGPKERVTSYLRPALARRLRNTVGALSGPPEHLTVAEVLARALEAELTRLERKHNGGEPFATAERPLRVGRPSGR